MDIIRQQPWFILLSYLLFALVCFFTKMRLMEKPAGHVPGSANDFPVSRLEDKEQDDKC